MGMHLQGNSWFGIFKSLLWLRQHAVDIGFAAGRRWPTTCARMFIVYIIPVR
jgi:hypothetical protein